MTIKALATKIAGPIGNSASSGPSPSPIHPRQHEDGGGEWCSSAKDRQYNRRFLQPVACALRADSAVMRVEEHPFLRLARIGPDEHHWSSSLLHN